MWIDLPSMRRNAFLLFNAVTIAFIAGSFLPEKAKNSDLDFKYVAVASAPSAASVSNVTKPCENGLVKDTFTNFNFSPWNLSLAEAFSLRPPKYFLSIIQQNAYYVFTSINAP